MNRLVANAEEKNGIYLRRCHSYPPIKILGSKKGSYIMYHGKTAMRMKTIEGRPHKTE